MKIKKHYEAALLFVRNLKKTKSHLYRKFNCLGKSKKAKNPSLKIKKLKIKNSTQWLRSQEGGILIWVISVSTFVILVFFSLSILTRRSILTMYENIESISAFFSAEGIAEEGIIRVITKNAPETLLAQEFIEGEISNYNQKIEKFLDRKNTTEYWLTDGQDSADENLEDIKKIKISWNYNGTAEESFGLVEKADISVLIGKWPKSDPYNLTTGYIHFSAEDSLIENGSFENVDLDSPVDFSSWEENADISIPTSPDDIKKGSRACQISTGAGGQIKQNINALVSSETYFLDFYTKKIDLPGAGTLRVYVCDGTVNCDTIIFDKEYSLESFYKLISEEISPASESAQIFFEVNGTSTPAVVDSIRINLKPNSSKYSEMRILQDGDSNFDMNNFNYIVFIKSGRNSTHFRLEAFGEDVSGNEFEVKLPDKVLSSEVTVNSKKLDLKKTIKIDKTLYIDGDSDFPYAENLLY